MERGGNASAGERDDHPLLPHPLFGRLDQSLAMAGTAALRQDRHPIEQSGFDRCLTDHDGAGRNLDVTDNSAGQPSDQPVGRVVLRMIDRRVKFGSGRWCRQAGEQLQDFRLVTGSGGGDEAFFLHPGWRCQVNRRMRGQVMNSLPVSRRTAAEDRARGLISTVLTAAERFRRETVAVFFFGLFFGAATAVARLSLLGRTAGRVPRVERSVAATRVRDRLLEDGRLVDRLSRAAREDCGREGVRNVRSGSIVSPVPRRKKPIPLAVTICRNSIDFQ